MGSIGLDELTPTVEEFTELPDGTYAATITNSEWRTSAAGNEYVSVEFTLTDQYPGRKIWSNFNFRHPDEATQKMANKMASQLVSLYGMKGWQEPEEVLGKNLRIRVGSNSKEPDRKEVKRYLSAGSGTPAPQPAATNGAAPGGNAFPWEAA